MQNGIDMIKELVGAVPDRDTYLIKSIKIKKQREKILVLLQESQKDISKSRMPECLKVLVDGKNLLLEVTVPESDVMEKEMYSYFKEKVYNSTLERKNEIRKQIADHILGSDTYLSGIRKNMVDEIYEIEVKSHFDKGFKRLRGIAYEQLKQRKSDIYNDKHVYMGNHGMNISVHTEYESNAADHINSAFIETKDIIDGLKNKNKKLYEKLEEIYSGYRGKIKKAVKEEKRITIESVLIDTMEEEIKKAIVEMEELEKKYIADEEAALEFNSQLAKECRKAIEDAIKRSITERTLQMDVSEEKSEKLVVYDNATDFVTKGMRWRVTKENQLFTVALKLASRGKIKDMTLFNPYFNERRYPELNVARIQATYSVGFDDDKKRYQSKEIIFFVELLDDEDKVKIWAAIGIWSDMDEADFKAMKPYFDENIKAIKEIEAK